jgi:hypothetical protein
VELEVERHASFVIAERADHVPGVLPPGNDSPVTSGQAAVGFQKECTLLGKVKNLLPQPGIEPCLVNFSDPNLVSSPSVIVGWIS